MSQSTPFPNANDIPPSLAMRQMISASWISQAIYVAAKLGIADLLKNGAKSSDELAQATRTHARSLYRLLRSLASLDIFTEDEVGRFALTPLAACLQTGVPGSLRSVAVFFGEAFHWQPWGEILHSVKTGKTAFSHVYGMEIALKRNTRNFSRPQVSN